MMKISSIIYRGIITAILGMFISGAASFAQSEESPDAVSTPSPKSVYENLQLFIRVMELVNDKNV